MANNRNTFIDFVKFVLIYIVTLGHTVQMIGYKNDPSFWNDIVFKSIYSFHMPLFIAISGYFTYFSLKKRTPFLFVKNRVISVLIPILCWTALQFLILTCVEKSYPKNIELYWFLWSVFIYSILAAVIKLLRINYMIGWGIVLILFFFVKFESRTLTLVFTLIPFFSLGFLLAMIDLQPIIKKLRKIRVLFYLLTLVFVHVWVKSDYIYNTPYNIDYYMINIFRFITGCVVSIAFLFVLYWFYTTIMHQKVHNLVLKIGTNTLVLYLLQATLFHFYTLFFMSQYQDKLYNDFISIVVSIVLLLVMYSIVCLLKKNKVLKKMFIGSD